MKMTYKQTTCLITTLLIFYNLQAQISQKGLVLLQNSGQKPLPLVTILVSGAIPTTSDNEGNFTLHFATRKDGDAVRTINVSKAGYELVNTKDIELWNISSNHPFLIVMCPKGNLRESRRKYYKIGEDRYKTLYRKKIEELEQAVFQNRLIKSEYEAKLNEANKQLQHAMEQLESYCDKFARLNRDILSELDRCALQHLDNGDVEGAIKVYEDANLLSKFKEKSSQIDSLKTERSYVEKKLREEIHLLEQENSDKSLQRRDSLLHMLP